MGAGVVGGGGLDSDIFCNNAARAAACASLSEFSEVIAGAAGFAAGISAGAGATGGLVGAGDSTVAPEGVTTTGDCVGIDADGGFVSGISAD